MPGYKYGPHTGPKKLNKRLTSPDVPALALVGTDDHLVVQGVLGDHCILRIDLVDLGAHAARALLRGDPVAVDILVDALRRNPLQFQLLLVGLKVTAKHLLDHH